MLVTCRTDYAYLTQLARNRAGTGPFWSFYEVSKSLQKLHGLKHNTKLYLKLWLIIVSDVLLLFNSTSLAKGHSSSTVFKFKFDPTLLHHNLIIFYSIYKK